MRSYADYVRDIVELGAENPRIALALERAIASYRKNRATALTRFPHTVEMAREVREIKERSIAGMEDLARQARDAIEKNHGSCYIARTAKDAYRVLEEIIGEGKIIVKAKSLTGEEIHLRQFLEGLGNEVYETDLGEFIIQLMDSRPMHLLSPAIHVPREDVARLLEEFTDEEVPADIGAMVARVRRILREKYFAAHVGMSGANVLSADTGTLFIIENEGNARLSIGAPPVQVSLVGMEKVVPTLHDAFKVAEVTWRYSNYRIPSYVNMVSGPSKTGDIEKVTTYGAHGPREMHVILLDNGRTEMARHPVFREALYCLRCGGCLYECPVYAVTAGYYGTQYMGGIGAVWDAFTGVGFEGTAPVAYTCLTCGRCHTMCPLEIDIPGMIRALREEIKRRGAVPEPIARLAEEIAGEDR